MKRKSEFSEAQYQSFIEYVLRADFKSNGSNFEINYYSGTEERERGYDIEVLSHIPIYLQVKRSSYYPSQSGQKIMALRNSWGYKDINGAYSFSLHIDKITGDYKQHNLLVDLNQNNSYARYIAPLFFKKSTLERVSYNQLLPRWSVVNRHLINEYDVESFLDWRDYVTFQQTITILPHKRVSKTKNHIHKYFFNGNNELSFHSEPEQVGNEHAQSLEDFIYRVSWDLNEGSTIEFSVILDKLISVMKKNILLSESNIIGDAFEKRNFKLFYFEFFQEEIKPRQNIWNMLMKKEKINIFNFLTYYLHNRFGIATYLVSKRTL